MSSASGRKQSCESHRQDESAPSKVKLKRGPLGAGAASYEVEAAESVDDGVVPRDQAQRAVASAVGILKRVVEVCAVYGAVVGVVSHHTTWCTVTRHFRQE